MIEGTDKKKKILAIILIIIVFGIITIIVGFFVSKNLGLKDKNEIEEKKIIDARDKQEYKTVKIGEQYWFAENLKLGKDGLNELNFISTKEEWENAYNEKIPAYVSYKDDEDNRNYYGYLYNWYALENINLCPEGWSVPSDEDWYILESYLAKDECLSQRNGSLSCGPAGAKMKIKDSNNGSEKWNESDLNCDGGNTYDCSGFNALPGGARYTSGTFFNIGSHTYFWSSTKNEDDNFWIRNLREGSDKILRSKYSGGLGMSIRCIEN